MARARRIRPIRGLWRLTSAFERHLGIAATFGVGAALIVVGGLMSLTIAGALIGLPLGVAGCFFLARALY